MRAIISAANHEGLTELARELVSHNVTIYSTSGTASALRAASIEAESVATLTKFPEILDGRVKTLHPAIFGGVLARRENITHAQELQDHGIVPIDVVVMLVFLCFSERSVEAAYVCRPHHGHQPTTTGSTSRLARRYASSATAWNSFQ